MWIWTNTVADPGEPTPPPPFLDQTEAQRAKKYIIEKSPPPHLRIWMTAPSPPSLSEGLDLQLKQDRVWPWLWNQYCCIHSEKALR